MIFRKEKKKTKKILVEPQGSLRHDQWTSKNKENEAKKKLKINLNLSKFDEAHNLCNKSEQRKITLRHIIVKVLKK